MDTKKDIRALSLDELKTVFTENGDQSFRAKQVYEWLWKKSARTFDEMTNLSKPTRELLNTHFVINAVAIDDMQISKDRTIKNAFKLYDSNIVEGVLIPSTTRMTACISSQVGCSLTCKFCATGKLERLRNLNADEIYDQVVLIKNQAETKYQTPLTNIVYGNGGTFAQLQKRNGLYSKDHFSGRIKYVATTNHCKYSRSFQNDQETRG